MPSLDRHLALERLRKFLALAGNNPSEVEAARAEAAAESLIRELRPSYFLPAGTPIKVYNPHFITSGRYRDTKTTVPATLFERQRKRPIDALRHGYLCFFLSDYAFLVEARLVELQ